MDAALAIRARGITKFFGEVAALDGVDRDIADGQVHGPVVPNGAGKTTLLGLLLGLAVIDAGDLEILGSPVRRSLALPDGVAWFVDGPSLCPSLTTRQNLAALARLRGGGFDGIDDALEQVGLTDVADDRVRGFSLGMRPRLGLAAASPDVSCPGTSPAPQPPARRSTSSTSPQTGGTSPMVTDPRKSMASSRSAPLRVMHPTPFGSSTASSVC